MCPSHLQSRGSTWGQLCRIGWVDLPLNRLGQVSLSGLGWPCVGLSGQGLSWVGWCLLGQSGLGGHNLGLGELDLNGLGLSRRG